MPFVDELAAQLEIFISDRWDKSLLPMENSPVFIEAEQELRGMVDEKAWAKIIEIYSDLSKTVFRKGFIEGLITTSAITKLLTRANEPPCKGVT